MINALQAQIETVQSIKLARDEENLLLKYENKRLAEKLENR